MAEQGQVLDVGIVAEVAADGRGDGVPAASVDDGVEAVAEHVGVVAQAPVERVVAVAAVERVVADAAVERVVAAHPIEDVVAVEAIEGVLARVAGQHVGEGVAGRIHPSREGQRQVLDAGVIAKVPGDRGGDGVDAAGVVDGVVGGPKQHVGVVAQPAHQGVGARAAIEDVVAVVAGEQLDQALPVALMLVEPSSVRFSMSG